MGRLLYSLQLAAKTPPSKPEPESESSAVYHLIHPHPGIEQRGGTWGERAWPSSRTAFDRSRVSQTTSGVSEDELARQAREFRQMMDAVETVDREIEYQRRRYEENMNLSSSEMEAGEWIPTGRELLLREAEMAERQMLEGLEQLRRQELRSRRNGLETSVETREDSSEATRRAHDALAEGMRLQEHVLETITQIVRSAHAIPTNMSAEAIPAHSRAEMQATYDQIMRRAQELQNASGT